jgi:glycosyltransferase involved in cell wall biosynthesis
MSLKAGVDLLNDARMPSSKFAYIFKRFPVFAQTFVVREVEGVMRLGRQPPIYSLQPPLDALAQDGFLEMEQKVTCMPSKARLSAEILLSSMLGKMPLQKCLAFDWARRNRRAKKAAFWLGPRLKQVGVSHVHTHFVGTATETAWWLQKEFGITYSVTAHANDFLCDYEEQVGLGPLMEGARAVVAVSDYSKRLLSDRFPRATVIRVYNGMQLDGFSKSCAESPPVVVSVGRLVEKKGFGILIEACRRLRERGVSFSCRIIGEGPLREDLEKQICDLRLTDSVFLYGAQSQGEIKKHLSTASLFALACVEEKSGGMDILPTVITEAMAARLPVVSSTLAGIPEMVLEGKTGILAKPGDPVLFADCMHQLLVNKELAIEMGEAGRRHAESTFAESQTLPALLEIFEAESVLFARSVPSARNKKTFPEGE